MVKRCVKGKTHLRNKGSRVQGAKRFSGLKSSKTIKSLNPATLESLN